MIGANKLCHNSSPLNSARRGHATTVDPNLLIHPKVINRTTVNVLHIGFLAEMNPVCSDMRESIEPRLACLLFSATFKISPATWRVAYVPSSRHVYKPFHYVSFAYLFSWDFNTHFIFLFPRRCLQYGLEQDTPLMHAPPTHVTGGGHHHLVGGAMEGHQNRRGGGRGRQGDI